MDKREEDLEGDSTVTKPTAEGADNDLITREKVKFFNVQNDIKDRKPTDPIEFARLKVLTFIQGNPVN